MSGLQANIEKLSPDEQITYVTLVSMDLPKNACFAAAQMFGGNIEAAANWALTEGMNLGNEEVLDNEANVIPSSIGNERGEESDFQGSAFAADVKEIREEEPASKIVRPKPINCFGNHSEALDEEFSNPEVVPTVERKKQAAIPVEENNTSEMVSFKEEEIDVDLCMAEFVVHKAIWFLDVDGLKRFQKFPELLNQVDLRGQTPLSLALRLDYEHIVQKLLELGADPRTLLGNGWSVLECLCAQVQIRPELQPSITNLFIYKLLHRTEEYTASRTQTLECLRNMPDFYMEIEWNVTSWIPLVSSLAPSDTFQIWKKGGAIRFDSHVRGFSGTQVIKGHVSYLVNEDIMLLVDHDKKTYQNAVRKFKNPNYDEMQAAVNRLMTTEQGRSALRTHDVTVSNKKSMLGYDKTATIGDYDCIQAICNGIKYSIIEPLNAETINIVPLPDYEEYFDIDNEDLEVEFCPNMTVNDNDVNVDLWLTQDFPVNIQDVGVVLRAVAPASEDVQRLANIFGMDFPEGSFPVKLVIPLMMSVSAEVTFSHYEEKEIPDETFRINETEYRNLF